MDLRLLPRNLHGMGKRVFWMRLAAVIISGLLVAATMAPYDATALIWLAFLPLLAALWTLEGKRRACKGFALGYVAGAVCFLIELSWLSVVTSAGAIILPLYLALYWGLFGAFAATLGNPGKEGGAGRTLGLAFANGAIWAGLEIARGWMLTGFGWNGLSVALHDQLPMAQAADLLGVAGLSGFLVFMQAAILMAIRSKCWKSGALALASVALVAGYGYYRISTERNAPSTRLKSLLVQINIPQEAAQMLWTAEEVHMAYEDETLKGLDETKTKAPDWVIWPECALTGRVLFTDKGKWGMWQENLTTIAQVRSGGSFHLIYGVNEMEAVEKTGELVAKEPARLYNSLAIMSPQDDLQTYRKNHLVIFGETIPFVDTIPLLRKIYEEQSGAEYGGSFLAGTKFDPLPVRTGDVTIGAIPTICFEDTVPRLTRKFVRPGPQVIVNVTNDGWFKTTQAAEQHFQNARFRAIELRRPMLRAANSGVSAAIDSTGSTRHPDTGVAQILADAKGSHFTRGTLLTELAIPSDPMFSLYARVGDAGVLTLSALGFFLAFTMRKRRTVQTAA